MSDTPRADGGSTDDSAPRLQLSYTLDDDEAPSTGVVKATAILTDTSPLDLEPLYDVIDPDHLDGMFQSSDGGTVFIETRFVYCGCTVTVTPETVYLERISDDC
ncbi:HalOD1 output domain-containing protein [Halopiger xanaduensis]|uniref:Halobacterial output domain-containing protein n=1 Tax=Halopiger xanaduensis (strain DSM 18323 / JCM 14033 / SH-6) TaxID=797210 RepID=F8D7A6_HALXS|nr:HalOD1 output domain-containing protein [Halopiger xanaduensis]AEH37823.1 hypothetical protein Halxa_3211 [Halopiger xanaduensis SH-6]